ncbi:uncharacterized protein LOC115887500 isoform X1 [Sitophilus oryzae]|uniref:Uncharacterized protein LOC115887500 isoform X1 n=1 Tax=Sitophilus oryzae TaxID=7048 RepID=A0A6J2YI63_SITOR|nr:uncharacterized protein LOC115887500 isoform X1 [Sitophilus oryzae]
MGFHETLIAQVQSYRALYDEKDKNYNNHQRKEEIWQIISQEIGETSELCRHTWMRIRYNYRRARRIRTIETRRGVKKNRHIRFEKALTFLNPYLKRELKPSEVPISPPREDNDAAEPNPTLDSVKSGSRFEKSSPSARSSSLNRTRENVQQPPVQNHLRFNHGQQVSQQSSVDPLDMFFSSMAATVKTFPAPLQLNTKQKIFQIATDAEATLINPAASEVTSDQRYTF